MAQDFGIALSGTDAVSLKSSSTKPLLSFSQPLGSGGEVGQNPVGANGKDDGSRAFDLRMFLFHQSP